MTGRHTMWDGFGPLEVDVPVSGGENVMVPVIRAVVRNADNADEVLVQRRDTPGEDVRGMLEIPGGKWGAGESPLAEIRREVLEETGIELSWIAGVSVESLDDHRRIATTRPLAVVSGFAGAFPAVHVVLEAEGRGVPRPEAGETADVRWWHIDELRAALDERRDEFVPSSHAALAAYVTIRAAG